MKNDLRFAIRMIASHRWFSLAVVTTLALGIGLNTMVFTLVNAVLFKPVPVPGGERLVSILNRSLTRPNDTWGMCYADFLEYKKQNTSLEAVEAATGQAAVVSEKGDPPENFRGFQVSSGMFEMLHVPPAMGRGLLPSDDRPGAEPVVLIGDGVWRGRYGSDPNIVGRIVRLNSKPTTIIGVMPPKFKFPSNEDMWTPLVPTPALESRTNQPVQLFALLKPGVSLEKARADFNVISQRIRAAHLDTNKDIGASVLTFHERYNGSNIKIVFLLMMAAVGFVLLIACANVANMMLSRALLRQREISIRAAMGASRWQLIRQLLIESLLLSIIGGVLGLSLTAAGVRGFDLATQDVGKPYWIQFTMNYTVFWYFAGICILSGLLFGLVPALRASRVDLNGALKEGTRSVGTRRGGRLAGALVVFQFGLTVVLLTGAGMFVRSLLHKQTVNSWMPGDHILGARAGLPKERYPDKAARLRFYGTLLPQLRALPGVTHVALTSSLPGLGAGSRKIEIEDTPIKDPARAGEAAVVVTSPGYFAAVNLGLILGHDFALTDGDTGRGAAIVPRQTAERYWPGQSPLGKRFRFYDQENDVYKAGEWMTVVGVTAEIDQQPMDNVRLPLVFVPYLQEGYEWMSWVIRTSGNPAAIAHAVRETVQNLDQDLGVYDVRSVAASMDRQLWALAVFGTIFFVFALIALLMASVGIYAVMAQATSSRTQEIGVRMALGANAGHILRLVLRRGVLQLGAGLIVGLSAAYPASRVMASLPFLAAAIDPYLFGGISAVLGAVGLFACWLPARAAAALPPVIAIRYE